MLKLFRPGSRPRRLVFGTLLLLALGGLLIVGYAGMFAPDADSQTVHPRAAIANTDVNPYGANFFLFQEVEEWKVRKSLELAREAGIVWAKQQFPWEELQPRRPKSDEDPDASYSWEKADRLVALMQEYDLGVIARLDRPPAWARTRSPDGQGPPDDFSTYGDFVYAFVSHFKGKIHYIQVWNEPNLWYEWGNRTPNPAEYTSLLRIASQRAKEADPNIYVLSAPLAMTTEKSPRALPEMDFLDQMYQNGAKPYFDILSANAFGFGWPPEDPASFDKLNFSRVQLQRDVMVRNGDAAKAVWFNEFGWNASPEGFSPDWYVWQRVTESNQADYTLRAVQRARTQWNWVGVLNIWYFRQVGTIAPDQSDYYFRMVDVDFTPRPVYQLVKAAAASQGVAVAGYFEESDPAVSTRGGWTAIRDERASGAAYLTPSAAGASLSFTFRGDRLELVVTRGPKGARLRVTVDGSEANALPLNDQGQAILSLNGSQPAWQENVLVASGLIQGAHTAQISVQGPAGPAPTRAAYPVIPLTPTAGAGSSAGSGAGAGVDAFIVSGGGRDPRPYYAVALVLAALAGLTGILLARDLRRRSQGLRAP
jgi:polysaccharide biosynthesis protein PslG